MNYTKSGIIASGAPFSRARFLGEVNLGLENPCLLLLTDEGNTLVDRFFLTLGCEPEKMPTEIKAEKLHSSSLFQFLVGVKFALELN